MRKKIYSYKHRMVLLFCLLAFAGISKSNAQCSVDNYGAEVGNSAIGPDLYVGQSFQAPCNELLNNILVFHSNHQYSGHYIGTVDVYAGGGTTGTLLTTQSYDVVAGQFDEVIVVFPTPLSLKAGNTYTFMITSTTIHYLSRNNNQYAGGIFYSKNNGVTSSNSATDLKFALGLTSCTPTTSSTDSTICSSALPFSWNGLTFNVAGTQTATLTNAAGCDSSATLNLSVKNATSSTTDSIICSTALPFLWNGLTFTDAGSQTKTGLINAAGCDSSATLNLSVKNATSSTTDTSICSSALPFLWNGFYFQEADTHTKTGLINAAGCDSSATLNLSVKYTTISTTNLSICSIALPFLWNGLTFNDAGTQTAKLNNAIGCDSLATLNLAVTASPSFTIASSNGTTVCSGQSSTLYTTGLAPLNTAPTLYYTGSNGATKNTLTPAVNGGGGTFAGAITAQVMNAGLACSGLVAGSLYGNIALISRGTCLFETKALAAQQAGAVAVVFYNNVAGAVIPNLNNTSITIPVFTITQTEGQALVAQINSGTTIITLSTTSYKYDWNNGVSTTETFNTGVLAAGANYSLKVTNLLNKCFTTQNIAIAVTPSTTNTTTVSSCDSYTWANTGQTYNASGRYTGTTTNCVTEVLNFTLKTPVGIASITPANNPICGGTKTTLTANGVTGTNAVVTWYDGPPSVVATGNVIGTGLTSPLVEVGTYYAVVTGDCGTPVQLSITLTSDVTNPLVTCPSNVSVNNTNTLNCAKAVVLTAPTYSDNCAVKALNWVLSGATNATSSLTGIKPITSRTFNNGITTVTYTVLDYSNLSASCSFNVTIIDVVKPSFTTTPTNINVTTSGCSASINVPDVSFTDNCGAPTLSWVATGATTGSGNTQVGIMNFNLGTTTLTYTLTDANTNVRTATITVKVTETIPPVITCPTNITTSTVGTSCTKNIATLDPVYASACGVKSLTWNMTGATVLSSPINGTWLAKTKTFKPGLTTVKYTATYLSGSTSTCTYTVQLNTNNTCPITNQARSIIANEETATDLKAVLSPNPTSSTFSLRVKSNSTAAVEVTVYNNEGKRIQQLKTANLNNIVIGEKYQTGSYMFEVRQGEKRTTVVGVKQ